MQNDIELLDLLVGDQVSQKDVYHAGPYWKPYGDRSIGPIRTYGIDKFRGSRAISKGFGEGGHVDPFDPMLLTSLKGKIFSRILNLPLVRKNFTDPHQNSIQSLWRDNQNYRKLYYSQLLGDWFL